MKFLVPNYSCLQNPWLRGYRPQISVLSVLNWICWTPPPKKIPGYATELSNMLSPVLLIHQSNNWSLPGKSLPLEHFSVITAFNCCTTSVEAKSFNGKFNDSGIWQMSNSKGDLTSISMCGSLRTPSYVQAEILSLSSRRWILAACKK